MAIQKCFGCFLARRAWQCNCTSLFLGFYIWRESQNPNVLKPETTDDWILVMTGISKPKHAQAFSVVRTEHMGFGRQPYHAQGASALALWSYLFLLLVLPSPLCRGVWQFFSLQSDIHFCEDVVSGLVLSFRNSKLLSRVFGTLCYQYDLPVGGEETSQGTQGASSSSVSLVTDWKQNQWPEA